MVEVVIVGWMVTIVLIFVVGFAIGRRSDETRRR